MKKYTYTGTEVRRFSAMGTDYTLKPGKETALPDCPYVALLVAQNTLVPVAPAPAPKSSTPKTTLTDGLS